MKIMSEFDDHTAEEAVLGKIAASGYETATQSNWIEVRNMIETRMLSMLQTTYQNKGFVGPPSQSFESRSNDLLTLLHRLGKTPGITYSFVY